MRLVLVLVVLMAGLVAAEELPDVILGDPNDSANDVLGEPISEAELEASLSLEFEDVEDDEDPIATSGYYEGDIMVENEDRLHQLLQDDGQNQNSAIKNPALIWPGGQIPYVISSTFSASERGVIARAMAEYHSNTCIRFVPRSSHAYYIHILRGQGCSSQVGRVSAGQVVSLGYGCVQLGVVMHELMHAAGFWHEQSRADRDSYVTINWSNIPSHLQYNFAKKSLHVTQLLGQGYDFGSLMHYGPYAFAINRNYPTISPRTAGVTIQSIGQRRGFSQLDREGLNKLYSCSGTTTGTGCDDKHRFCASWSTLGYCTSNAAYMNTNCKKSCKLCGGTGGGSCKDVGQFCADWAAKGECQKNPAYMSLECKKSCNMCGGTGDCTDDNQFCSDWASKGECTRNQAYMELSCRKSCKFC